MHVILLLLFSFVCVFFGKEILLNTINFMTAGMTTGTPINVFVPNIDPRGHVSDHC